MGTKSKENVESANLHPKGQAATNSYMDSTTKPPNRFASLIGGLILGLVIAGMGAAFCVVLMKGFDRAQETRQWTETPCEIVRSEVIEHQPSPNSPMSYISKVEYYYTYNETDYTGKNVKRVEGPTNHREMADATVAAWPVGKKGTCFVNPSNPTQVILTHNTRAAGYSVWFPGLFVIGGVGIVIGSIRNFIKQKPA